MKAIVNCHIITPRAILRNSILLIDHGQIIDFGPANTFSLPLGCEVIDAYGGYVGPGFIDLHCHGGGGVWWFENPVKFASTHLRHGTTGLLATTGMHKDFKELCEGIRTISITIQDKTCENILGIHMEGPYKNPKYGAQPKLSLQIKKAEYEEILKYGRDIIKIWTIAPELSNIDAFIRDIRPLGYILSVGHSEATPEEIFRLIPDGLKLACHCMNATGINPRLKGPAGTREVGVDEAVLLEDSIFAEVIPDALGYHVRPLMLRLIVKTKGVDRVVLITDGTAGSGKKELSPGETDVNYNENGLCGSFLTMDIAAGNMMRHTGLSLREVFIMTSLNPARVLNLDHAVGSIERWKIANLVIIDEAVNIRKVFLNGEEVDR